MSNLDHNIPPGPPVFRVGHGDGQSPPAPFRVVAFEEIERMILDARYRAEPLSLSPETCRRILDLNLHNRPFQKNHAARLAALMRDGLWNPRNGDTITFTTECKLDDGQHRLRAAAEAGYTLDVLAVFGADPEGFATKDQGKARTGSDILAIAGESDTTGLAALAAILWRLAKDPKSYDEHQKLPKPMILDVVAAFTPGIKESMARCNTNEIRSLCQKTVPAALHYMASKINPEAAETFISLVESGAGLEATSPILKLRPRMIGRRDSGRISQGEILALWIKAWNLWRDGRPCQILAYKKGEQFPIPR